MLWGMLRIYIYIYIYVVFREKPKGFTSTPYCFDEHLFWHAAIWAVGAGIGSNTAGHETPRQTADNKQQGQKQA